MILLNNCSVSQPLSHSPVTYLIACYFDPSETGWHQPPLQRSRKTRRLGRHISSDLFYFRFFSLLRGTHTGQPSHTMRATFTSERKSNVRSTSSETNLAQSVSHSFLWLPTVVKAVSVAVTWRLRRWARQIALSWRGVAMRGRPRRGRSATLLVSLRRRTRRSTVETFTPKCKAKCCCLWPCISNAIAWPLWNSVSRDMITRDSN
jgi:hypothetical protein